MSNQLKSKFQNATQLLAQGKIRDAEQEFLAIRAEDPTHFLATYNLAVVAAQTGRLNDAEKLLASAMFLRPDVAQGHLVHAKVLSALTRIDDAIAAYDRFLALHPDHADALADRSAALLKANRFAEALDDTNRALTANPQHIVALYNNATALDGLGRLNDALDSLARAIAVQPGFAEALLYRGNLLRRLRRDAEAIASYQDAVTAAPQRSDLFNNLGSTLFDAGRWDEALQALDRAVALQPDNYEAYVNRGRVLGKLGRPDEELAAYNRSLALRPDFAEALVSRGVFRFNLRQYADCIADLERAVEMAPAHEKALHAYGNALLSLGRRADAIACYERALRLNPAYVEVLNNLGLAQRQLNRFGEAVETFKRLAAVQPGFPFIRGDIFSAQLQICDWNEYNETSASITADVRKGMRVENPFLFLAHSTGADDQLACARIYTAEKFPSANLASWRSGAHDDRAGKIKLTYVSADFHNHATAHLMAGLFACHDRTRFDITAVSFGPNDGSDMRLRLETSFDSFIDAAQMADSAVVDLIRARKTDIAVDLKGFTNDARPGIFAQRVAPLQVNYLGYPCTWGAPCMDYLVADDHLVPAGDDMHYAEKIVRLPDTYQPNDNTRRIDPHSPTRAEAGLPEHGFVFCCFNGNYKITPSVFDIWMRLLRAVDGSVLWLFEGSATVKSNLRAEAVKRGVSPDRLIFAPFMPPERHLARHCLADIFLDTSPINAHTTASDALWAGLPIITFRGSTFAGRVAGSLLAAIGLPELIAESWSDYESLALRLAHTPDALEEIRAKLHRNRATHPLFDTKRMARHIEAAYMTMQDRQQRGLPPESFWVTPVS